MSTTTDEATAEVVHAYYEVLRHGTASFDPARLRELLAPDLHFEGPIAGTVVGAEYFVAGVTGFAETMNGLTMRHQLTSGEESASLYDAEMPGGTVRFAEFFHVADGRIRSLRLLYDATEYTARGGR